MSDLLGPIPCISFQPYCDSWNPRHIVNDKDVRGERPCSCASLILVLVLDQWSSTSPDLKRMSMADFAEGPPVLSGNDAEAAVRIFGGERRLMRVRSTDGPQIGSVWMRDDPATGKLVVFKAHYDSSG